MWFYLILILTAPLVLESVGFYQRPLLASRRTTILAAVQGVRTDGTGFGDGLVAVALLPARLVVLVFGVTSFGLVLAKEELLRLALKSDLAQEQYRRRFVLVGAREELPRMRQDLARRRPRFKSWAS